VRNFVDGVDYFPSKGLDKVLASMFLAFLEKVDAEANDEVIPWAGTQGIPGEGSKIPQTIAQFVSGQLPDRGSFGLPSKDGGCGVNNVSHVVVQKPFQSSLCFCLICILFQIGAQTIESMEPCGSA
jgi:hypothetical protein